MASRPPIDPKYVMNWDTRTMGPRPMNKAWAKSLGLDPETCPPVPAGGPGKAKLNEMVGEARRIGKTHNIATGLEGLSAGLILAEKSRDGGDWDIKNLRDAQRRKRFPKGQEFGDFLYGATSTAMGFSPMISDLGADLYSLKKNGTLEDKDEWIHSGQRYARLRCDER